MLGQGRPKVQDMNLRDPGEKGENFKAVIFATNKKHCFDAEFYGKFNNAIYIFLDGIFLSKNELENFTNGHFQSFSTI